MGILKNFVYKRIIRAIFDSKLGRLVFGWADGYKTIVGRILGLTSVIIATVQSHFPEYPIITDINTIWLMVSAILVTELGLEHKQVKSER